MLQIKLTSYQVQGPNEYRHHREPNCAYVAVDVYDAIERKDQTLKNKERAELAKVCAMVMGVTRRYLLENGPVIRSAYIQEGTRRALLGIGITKISSINNLHVCRGRLMSDPTPEVFLRLVQEVNAFTRAILDTSTTHGNQFEYLPEPKGTTADFTESENCE